MKKKNLTFFAMLFVCATLAFGFSACAQKHEHIYDRQLISEDYLAKKATCTTKARYYYVCSCGKKSTETFEYGETLEHIYNRQLATVRYLSQKATCTEKARYYYSCLCGLSCGETFEYGDFAPHPVESEWSYNETHHWHNSTCECNVKIDYGEHKIDDSGCCSVCNQAILSAEGVIYDISADGTYAEVIGYEGTSKYVKISDTYNNLPVHNIYREAFKDTEIITVIIPDGVTSIGGGAFHDCRALTSITIPDSVTSIGDEAFYRCRSLTSITIPDSVTYLGGRAFCGCSSLISITVPDGVTSIGDSMFSFCSYLTSVTIPESVIYIDSFAFYMCYKLQYNVYGNAKYLGNADNPYHALIRVESENLSAYEIHSKTKVICNSAFYSCGRLVSIIIPDGVTYIDHYAFGNCSSLTSVIIPESVTSIGHYVFSSCSSLMNITYKGTKSQWKDINKVSSWNAGSAENLKICCTDGEIKAH